jgi:hypothetical protein
MKLRVSGAMTQIQMFLLGASVLSALGNAPAAQAQAPPCTLSGGHSGNKIVYNSSGTSFCTVSQSSVDASAYTGANICEQIYNAIPNALTGGTVDARGITTNTGGVLTCATGETPWRNSTGSTRTKATTVLLPPGTIILATDQTWVPPSGTRLIGMSALSPPTSSPSGGTILQVPSNFTGTVSSSVIEMCSSACTGVTIENLTIDGTNDTSTTSPLNGILNKFAGQGSYINNVTFNQVLGVGLTINGTSAQGSGPYTNLKFDDTANQTISSTSCVELETDNTLGLHSITCLANDANAQAGIYVDASHNTIEDVLVQGFQDGIVVGQNASAEDDIIIGFADTTSTTEDKAAVELASNASNIVVLGISNLSKKTIVEDDVTGFSPTGTPSMAVYVLGSSGSGGYSRLSTGVGVIGGAISATGNPPTWASGSVDPPLNNACAPGSMYSDTASTSGFALYVCSATTHFWVGVK